MSRCVDIVIVTRDTREAVLNCSRSVSEVNSLARCIVVDNGSTDGTQSELADRAPHVHVIRNDVSESFARSCNRGAAAGSAPFVLFLNSDTVAHEGAVDRLATFLQEHPAHVVAAGALVDPGTLRPQVGFAIRGYPTLVAQVALLVGLERVWPANPASRRQLMRDFDYGTTQDINAQPAGACILCRRSAFEAERGFDEQFELWFEDVDLLLRLRQRGRIAYVHDALFAHVGGLSVAARPRAELVHARYAGLLRYFKKHRPPVEYLAIRATVLAVASVRGLAVLPVDRSRASAYAAAALAARRGA